MVSSTGRHKPADQLVHDVTLCARRALKRAAAAERLKSRAPPRARSSPHTLRSLDGSRSSSGAGVGTFDLSSTLGSGAARGLMSVSSDSLSLRYQHESSEVRKSAPQLPTLAYHTAKGGNASVGSLGSSLALGASTLGASSSGLQPETRRMTTTTTSASKWTSTEFAGTQRLGIADELKKKSPLYVQSPRDEEASALLLSRGGGGGGGGGGGANGKDGRKASSSVDLKRKGSHNGRSVHKTELTGPVNWSLDDLRVKYRDELSREEAWRASTEGDALACERARRGVQIAVARVDRHPVLIQVYGEALRELTGCLGRARLRGLTRRFVLDVHQLWLTNLEHLERGSHAQSGRHARADTKAVLRVRSQIQSVAPDASATHLKQGPTLGEVQRCPPSPAVEPPLPHPCAAPPSAVTAVLLFGEPLRCFKEGGSSSSEDLRLYVERRCATLTRRARWRLVAFDAATSSEVVAVLRESDVLAALAQDEGEKLTARDDAAGDDHSAVARAVISVSDDPGRRVHQQAARVRGPGATTIPACVQLFLAPANRRDAATANAASRDETDAGHASPDELVQIEVVAVASAGHCFRVARLVVSSLDVIAHLGLSHAPLRDRAWWACASHAGLWRTLCEQLSYHPPQVRDQDEGQEHLSATSTERGVLALRFASAESSLALGFDFHAAAWRAIALAKLLALDSSRAERPRLVLRHTAQAVGSYADDATADANAPPTLFETWGDAEDAPAVFRLEERAPPASQPGAPSLSMMVCGAADRWNVVPGVVAVGPCGLGFASDRERRHLPVSQREDCAVLTDLDQTEAVAIFDRTRDAKTTDSVLVTVCMALDCKVLVPTQTAWDASNRGPPQRAEEWPEPRVSGACGRKSVKDREPFQSLVMETISGTLVVLAGQARALDFAATDAARRRSRQSHRRNSVEFCERGFRLRCEASLLRGSSEFGSTVFSLAEQGTTRNRPAMLGRNTFHSEEACSEQLCRQRTSKDFHGVLQAKRHSGANDPSFYTAFFSHERLASLGRGGLRSRMAEVERQRLGAEREAKTALLFDKIERGKALLAEREQDQLRLLIQDARGEQSQELTAQHEEEEDSIASIGARLLTDELVAALADKLGISPLQIAQNQGALEELAQRRLGELEETRAALLAASTTASDAAAGAADQDEEASLQSPYARVGDGGGGADSSMTPGVEEVPYWRRLYRGRRLAGSMRATFADARTQGCAHSLVVNTCAKPVTLGLVRCAQGIAYQAQTFDFFAQGGDAIFLDDALKDTARAMEIEAGAKHDERASTEDRIVAQLGDVDTTVDAKVGLDLAAVANAKAGNVEQLEECLDQEVFIDCVDKFGNTLLILAAQGNNKRLVKTLLRRGANINAQNAQGNTSLHYCHEYSYEHLAAYLQEKGADDSILNMRKLTCYEGLDGKA